MNARRRGPIGRLLDLLEAGSTAVALIVLGVLIVLAVIYQILRLVF